MLAGGELVVSRQTQQVGKGRRLVANNSSISPGLLLALLVSVLLHLAVLFGASMMPPPLVDTLHPIEVRLVPTAPLVSPVKAPAMASTDLHILESVKERPRAPMALTSLIAFEATEASIPTPPALPNKPSVVTTQSGMFSADADSYDPTYYPIEQLDKPPRLVGDIQQVYPARARKAGIEGFVTLSLLINERGEVDEIHVMTSQPVDFFEESAMTMLRGQRFTPAIKHSRAVKSQWQKTVRFKLQD